VLRTQKLGEADRIITILTRRNGRIRAVARGVRKTSSRIGARLEPFNHVDVQLYEGKSLDNVSQVETIDPIGGKIAGDYAKWTAGTVMLETAERLTSEERNPQSSSTRSWSRGCDRWLAMSMHRLSSSMRICCAAWRWLDSRHRSMSAPAAVSPVRIRPSTSKPAG